MNQTPNTEDFQSPANANNSNGAEPRPIGGRPGASGSGQADSISKYLPERPGGGRTDSNATPHDNQGEGC